MGKRAVNSHTKRKVAALAAWRCAQCDTLVDEHYEIDHRIPLHLGGNNDMANLQLLCYRCHKNKTAAEMAAAGPWLSIAYCRVCKGTYSKYFRHVCSVV